MHSRNDISMVVNINTSNSVAPSQIPASEPYKNHYCFVHPFLPSLFGDSTGVATVLDEEVAESHEIYPGYSAKPAPPRGLHA